MVMGAESFLNHNFSFCARQDWAGLVETLTRPPRLKDKKMTAEEVLYWYWTHIPANDR
jgi:hypothetical protein